MENTTTPTNQETNPSVQQLLPNSTSVLVLGILSIPTCFCGGVIGITLGIIALVLSGKAKTLYDENPDKFTIGSYKNMNAGRVCAIIGTSLSGIAFIGMVIKWIIVGSLFAIFTQLPWETF